MLRDVEALTARTFDLLVVGGGIYGLWIAYDAAQRGLGVALVERDDFGSGASFNHLRTIHGGLRYLQALDVRRARESIGERRTLARIAPHAVRPLAFVLPLYPSLAKGKMAMRAGVALDRLVSFDRNRDVPAALRLPHGRVVSRSEAIERFPGLRRRRLTGAAIWYDYVTTESDRLTLSVAVAAAMHGAVLANHVEATAPLVDHRRVRGVQAVDRTTGRAVEIDARLTVNASGAGVDCLLEPLGVAMRLPLLKAMNLVTRRDAGPEALLGRSESGRHLVMVPWRGRALFGTWESPRPCAPDDAAVRGDEVAAFIAELNEVFPSLDLTAGDVTLVHRGLVPAVVRADGGVALEPHEQVRDHRAQGVDRLFTVAGAKYTTARAVAERIVDLALVCLERSPVASRTAITPLGGGVPDVDALLADARREFDRDLPSDALPHLVASYGSRYRDVLALAATRPELSTKVADDSPVIAAELVWAARAEMVVTLADAVIRRTPLGALGYPGNAAVDRAADLVGGELGWSAERRRVEAESVRAFYGSVNALKT